MATLPKLGVYRTESFESRGIWPQSKGRIQNNNGGKKRRERELNREEGEKKKPPRANTLDRGIIAACIHVKAKGSGTVTSSSVYTVLPGGGIPRTYRGKVPLPMLLVVLMYEVPA